MRFMFFLTGFERFDVTNFLCKLEQQSDSVPYSCSASSSG